MRTAIFLVILTAAVSASPAGAIAQEQVYRVGDSGAHAAWDDVPAAES